VRRGFFVAWGSSHVEARESSHVEAWGSSHVVAWESSHVEARESSHVEAWGSSHVEARESSHVEAWGSSHVVAWGSSHVVAWESSHVEAWGSSHVEASKYVAIHKPENSEATISGGIVIEVKAPRTPEEWCDYYGVAVRRGVVTLYKALNDVFGAPHNGFLYTPGSKPKAPDWDGGKAECGGGLHFSPSPVLALQWYSGSDVRFVACPVRLKEVVVHHPAVYPAKVKAPRVCGRVYEVDRFGKRIEQEKEVAA
jgi:hypothetical protein